MQIITSISSIMVPLVIIGIVVYGLLRRVEPFVEFTNGARQGMKTVVDIIPTFIGLMVAIGVLRASGTFELLSKLLTPLAEAIHFPDALIPLVLMRTVSASAASGLLFDLFKNYGPDSFVGRVASVIMGCTEAIFYTMALYFMVIKVKKTKYTLQGALIATLSGVIASLIIVSAIWY